MTPSRLLSFATFALAALLGAGCGTTSAAGTTTGAAVAGDGDLAPPFRAQTLDGARLDLAHYLGKDVVFVSFWATYCEPCKSEMPSLQRFHERFAKDGLTVVSVAMDGPDTKSGVSPYIRKQGYTFAVVIDEDGAITQALNPTATAPYAVLVGRDGRIKKRIAGFQPSEAPAIEAEIEALVKPVSTP
jgi:peroxiredoxin